MALDGVINTRVDRVTKLRLEAEAAARQVLLSELVRDLLWEHVRLPTPPGDGSPSVMPTLDEAQALAIRDLGARYRRGPNAWANKGEKDQVRWVRACISEIPELVHADPHWILSQLRKPGDRGEGPA